MSDATLTKAQAETIRAECMVEIVEGVAEQTRGALRAGRGLLRAETTFTAGETKAFQTWAENVSGKAFGTCRSYMAVARMVDGQSKPRQTKVQNLTFENLQAIVSTPEDHRPTVIDAIGKGKPLGTKPTVEMIREYRDEVVPVDPAEAAEKAARAKKAAADKTLELVKELSPKFKQLRNNPDRDAVILAVLKLQTERKGQDIASAFRQYVTQHDAAVKAAAAKEKKLADAVKVLAPTAS